MSHIKMQTRSSTENQRRQIECLCAVNRNCDNKKSRNHILVGKIDKYCSHCNKFFKRSESIYMDPNPSDQTAEYATKRTISLQRGGAVTIYKNILSEEERLKVVKEIEACEDIRQYPFNNYIEPRVHKLLVKTNDTPDGRRGYQYHNTTLKGHPIEDSPEISKLADRLATLFEIPHGFWNIGVDVLVYRDGQDCIKWHSDDTQGEDVVFSLVVEDSIENPRPIKFRPKQQQKQKQQGITYQHGDENIELKFPPGFGYHMDDLVQEGYEHCVPRGVRFKSRRIALIFRHGIEKFVEKDSGTLLKESNPGRPLLAPPIRRPTVSFGPMDDILKEGDLYIRNSMFTNYTHRGDMRGVNGSAQKGSDSIVVSKQDETAMRHDTLDTLRYSATTKEGARSLHRNMSQPGKGQPVRVFRSSNLLTSKWKPPNRAKKNSALYRYDGLYVIKCMMLDGNQVDPGSNLETKKLYTFHLEREECKEGGNKIDFETLRKSILETKNKTVNM